MRWTALIALLAILAPTPALAQAYEAIGFCKRNVGVLLACIVAEKIGDAVIESVVEKSVQEWWDYWQSGAGQSVGASTGDATGPDAAQIAQSGVDYRTLMQDLGDLVPSPGSLRDDALIADLASACAGSSRMICGEFSPLFPGLMQGSSCGGYVDEVACTADPACEWRFNLCVTPSE
jgi:hypothetical protein